MAPSNRREFLSDVGRGMVAAGLGASLANDLGFSTAFADRGSTDISIIRFTTHQYDASATVIARFGR